MRKIVPLILAYAALTFSGTAFGEEKPRIGIFFEEKGHSFAHDGIGFSRDGSQVWVLQNPIWDQDSEGHPGWIEVYDLEGRLVKKTEIRAKSEDDWFLGGFLLVFKDEIVNVGGIVWKKEKETWNSAGRFRFPIDEPGTQIEVIMAVPGRPGSYLARVNRWLYSVSLDRDPVKLGEVFFHGFWAPHEVPTPSPGGAPVKPDPPKNEPLDESLFHVRTFGTNGVISYPRGFWKQLVFRIDENGSLNKLPEIPHTVQCKSFHLSEDGIPACLTPDTPHLLWTRNDQVEHSIPLPEHSTEVTWLPSGRILVEALNDMPALYIADPQSGKVSEPLILPGAEHWVSVHPKSGAILASTGNWYGMNRWFLLKEGLKELEIVRKGGTSSPVTCIVPDEERSRVFAMHETGEIRVLDAKAGKQVGAFQAAGFFGDYRHHLDLFSQKPIEHSTLDETSDNRWYSLAASPDGKILVAGSDPGCIDVIDTVNPRNHTYRYLGGFRINGIRFLDPIEGGYRVALYNRSWKLHIVDIFPKEKGFHVTRVREITGSFGFAYDMDRCATSGRFGAIACSYWRGIRTVDYETGTMRFVGDVPGPGHGVAAIPGSKLMLGAYNNSEDDVLIIIRFDPENGEIDWKAKALSDLSYGALAASAEWWAACNGNNRIRVGRIGAKDSVQEITLPDPTSDECAQCLAFLKDGTTLLVGSASGRVVKIDLK